MMINNDPCQSAQAMHPAMSLKVPNLSNYNGAECLALQKANPVKKIENLKETQKIPKSIEIRPKALETYGNGIGSKLNLWT